VIDFENLTWSCHVCKEVRPNAAISVFKKDTSAELNLPPGHVVQNVRYCNDNSDCTEKAKTYDHIILKKVVDK